MTTQRDPERLLAAYLADGMEVLPDRVVDAVLDEVHQTRQRAVFGPRRTPLMSSAIKFVIAAAAVVAVAVVGFNVLLPQDDNQIGGPAAASPSPVVSPSPATSPSPEPSPSSGAVQMTFAGTDVVGPEVHLTLELPDGWSMLQPFAAADDSEPTTMLILSVVDNTFSDPCGHVQRDPKVGSTVEGVATALSGIPETTATAPVQTTVGGQEATYIELSLAETLSCAPTQFYWWQDSPDNYTWPQSADETMLVWILDVQGRTVVIAARTYPETSEQTRAELQQALDSIVFDTAP